MISIDKIERGFVNFVDRELSPMVSTSTVKGVALSVGAAIVSKRIGSALASLKDNDMLKALKMVDESGNVDIDIIREELVKKMTPEGIKVEIPFVADLVLKREDVDKLYRYIIEA